MRKPKLDAPDEENPEWTQESIDNAVPLTALPKTIRDAIAQRKTGQVEKLREPVPSAALSAD